MTETEFNFSIEILEYYRLLTTVGLSKSSMYSLFNIAVMT